MNVRAVKLVYFSPTHTTKRVLEGIARGFQAATVEHLDLTPPQASTREFVYVHDELAIIGGPVYGGRIPPVALDRLRRIKGNDTPAVVVAVYGNREYEDALLEVRDVAKEQGFRPVAGGAFIGEHSYHTEAMPIAPGRPDSRDLEIARSFGELTEAKLKGVRALGEMSPLQVPGDFPYRKFDPPLLSPVTHERFCTLCETCAAVCPTSAIAVGDTVVTDPSACILCSACVKGCPTGARVWEAEWVLRAARWLSKDFAERKEPEMYV